MKNTTGSGSKGRPKGSFSFVTVKGADILAFLQACPEAEFPISAKYASEVGLKGRSGPAVKIHTKSVTATDVISVTSIVPTATPDTTPVPATP